MDTMEAVLPQHSDEADTSESRGIFSTICDAEIMTNQTMEHEKENEENEENNLTSRQQSSAITQETSKTRPRSMPTPSTTRMKITTTRIPTLTGISSGLKSKTLPKNQRKTSNLRYSENAQSLVRTPSRGADWPLSATPSTRFTDSHLSLTPLTQCGGGITSSGGLDVNLPYQNPLSMDLVRQAQTAASDKDAKRSEKFKLGRSSPISSISQRHKELPLTPKETRASHLRRQLAQAKRASPTRTLSHNAAETAAGIQIEGNGGKKRVATQKISQQPSISRLSSPLPLTPKISLERQSLKQADLRRYGMTVREAMDAEEIIMGGSKTLLRPRDETNWNRQSHSKPVDFIQSCLHSPENTIESTCELRTPSLQRKYPPRSSSLPQSTKSASCGSAKRSNLSSSIERLSRPTNASILRQKPAIQEKSTVTSNTEGQHQRLVALRRNVKETLRKVIRSTAQVEKCHTTTETVVLNSIDEANAGRAVHHEGIDHDTEKDLTEMDLDGLTLVDHLIENSTNRLRLLLTHARSLPDPTSRRRLEPMVQRLSTRLLEARRVQLDLLKSVRLVERLVVDVSRDVLNVVEQEKLAAPAAAM